MDDYSALAYRIAGGVADVQGCLILSRDGLILGSYPDDETVVKPAWVRFASLGDPERSFVEFGDQVWVYIRRLAYGAFAVANAGVRPGLVIDQLEGILLSAEESRNRRDTLRVPEAAPAPSGKPRTSLHPIEGGVPAPSTTHTPSDSEARFWARGNPDTFRRAPSIAGEVVRPTVTRDVGRLGERATADRTTAGPAEASDDDAAEQGEADTHEDRGDAKGKQREIDAEVDPVMLAKEFSGLLQVKSGDDETSS